MGRRGGRRRRPRGFERRTARSGPRRTPSTPRKGRNSGKSLATSTGKPCRRSRRLPKLGRTRRTSRRDGATSSRAPSEDWLIKNEASSGYAFSKQAAAAALVDKIIYVVLHTQKK